MAVVILSGERTFGSTVEGMVYLLVNLMLDELGPAAFCFLQSLDARFGGVLWFSTKYQKSLKFFAQTIG